VKVDMKCFATLSDKYTCDFQDSSLQQLHCGQTVSDLLRKQGISRQEVKIIFVNGKKVDFDTVLGDGDHIGLAPAVGGM
jgi:molybdopterin converting factor small subunit